MTLFCSEEVQCAVCGATVKMEMIESTEMHGAYDLDTRPPMDARATMSYWIGFCPKCHYASYDISLSTDEITSIVQTREYQNQFKHSKYPELAQKFLASGFIYLKIEEYHKAISCFLSAAWVCDDFLEETLAVECRTKVTELFTLLKQEEVYYVDELADDLVLIDVCRRSNQWDVANTIIDHLLKHTDYENIRNIVQFQQQLIEKKDVASYNFEDVLVWVVDQ